MEEQLKRDLAQPSPWYYILNGILVKKYKPCYTGDRIHLHNIPGCFNVHHVNVTGITIMRSRRLVVIPWSEFRCKWGQGEYAGEKAKLQLLSLYCAHRLNKIKELQKGH